MQSIFQDIKNFLKRELSILWIFGVLLGLALVALDLKGKLPLGKGDFVFISFLALLVALYRPRWVFFLFVSLIPLENIILVSGFLPLQLRPYQFAGTILTLAIVILWIYRRLDFGLLKPTWIDWLVFSLVPLSFLSVINSPAKNISLKNNLILLSFVVLYYLTRNFLRKREDLVKTAFFFLGSSIVVFIFGYYQVFADKFDVRSFEVMFGRPNSTFAEPDWLGIFLCFSLAALLSLISYFVRSKQRVSFSKKYILIALDILVFLDITLIILTLSRSAWIGMTIVMVFWLLLNLFEKGNKGVNFTPAKFGREFLIMFLIGAFSLGAVHFGKLSKFDIFDRARSAATSQQKITIACEDGASVPQIIPSTDELQKFGCRHINLEEIENYKSRGMIVAEMYRKDPNVLTRSQIYRKSWEIVRENPVLGVGFGTITQNLGVDGRGAGLNESNIFLQVLAGSGILGLIAFLIAVFYLFMHSFRKLSPVCPLQKWLGCPVPEDIFEKTLSIFTVLGILALLVPNLFNAGLLMGLFWLGLAVFVSIKFVSKNEKKKS